MSNEPTQHQQYDFSKGMPTSPAQDAVSLLTEIRDLLKAAAPKPAITSATDASTETPEEHAAKIAKLQARVPVAKRK